MKPDVIKLFIFVLAFQLFFALPCLSEEKKPSSEAGIEDILEGFDDDIELSDPIYKNSQTTKESPISFKGHFKLGMVYNYAHDAPLDGKTDWRGLSSLRGEIFSEIKIDFSDNIQGVVSGNGFYDTAYYINDRSDYTEQVLDTYEYELEFREAYIQGSFLKNLDIKLGRQIVVWGTSDYIRVTDVLNPLDNREPGMTDIEDLRLPLTMSRMDCYFKDISLTAIAVHEKRFNKNPVFGSDFYPFETALPRENIPKNNWDNTEWAISLKGIANKLDYSFYLARIYNDQAHMAVLNPQSSPTLTMNHAKIKMAGMAAQLAYGNWLFKAEAAYFDGLRFFNQPYKTFARFDYFFGIEYFGFKETLISLEVANRHINNWELSFESSPDYALKNDFQAALKISKDYLNKTLNFTFLGSIFGIDAENGSFQRYSLEYHFTDAWSILTGVVTYQSGDKIEMKNIGKNDRVFFNIKYSF